MKIWTILLLMTLHMQGYAELNSPTRVLKTLNDFERVEDKKEGTGNTGGIYREIENGSLWLIKFSDYDDSIVEYISGEILAYILGNDRVARYEFIKNSDEDTIITGTPLLENFSMFADLYEGSWPNLNYTSIHNVVSCIPYGCEIKEKNIVEKFELDKPSIVDGKTLVGFDQVIIACLFVADDDFNDLNLGYIVTENELVGAKVDHGWSLSDLSDPVTLNSVREAMCELGTYIDWRLGYDETLNALTQISELNGIDAIIDSSIDYIMGVFGEDFISHVSFSGPLVSSDGYRAYLKRAFKLRQLSFKEIANGMRLEKALRDKDFLNICFLQESVSTFDSYYEWKSVDLFDYYYIMENYLNFSETINEENEDLIDEGQRLRSELCEKEAGYSVLDYVSKYCTEDVLEYLKACFSKEHYKAEL